MEFIAEAIEAHKAQTLALLRQEEADNGGYAQWYAALGGFRDALRPYVARSFGDKVFQSKRTRLPSGDVLDHHVTGYFAPLDFTRRGWGKKRMSPAEQIILLDRYLRARGVRFVYAALPCKGVLYPELAVDPALLKGLGSNSPQWRKLMREAAEAGVEVLDLYPFCMEKRRELNFYTKDHYLSPLGAEAIGRQIALHLKKTTRLPAGSLGLERRGMSIDFSCPDGAGGTVRERYEGYRVERPDGEALRYPGAELALFGNCNLQAYEGEQAGIYASLLYHLDRPVEDLGRRLPFSASNQRGLPFFERDGITKDALAALGQKTAAVYLGFPSAAFVRTSQFYSPLALPARVLLHGSKYADWSTTELCD